MSITQIETLLTEATTKYLKTGEGKEDVAMMLDFSMSPPTPPRRTTDEFRIRS